MATIEEIEQALLRLSPTEFDAFRDWFADLDSVAWDRQMENDIATGRLDSLADEAIADLRAGRCSEL